MRSVSRRTAGACYAPPGCDRFPAFGLAFMQLRWSLRWNTEATLPENRDPVVLENRVSYVRLQSFVAWRDR